MTVRRGTGGRTLVLCPYGHLVDVVERGQWATSVWSVRVGWGEVVTCHGVLPRAK